MQQYQESFALPTTAYSPYPRAPAAPPKDDYVQLLDWDAKSECANNFGAARESLSESRILASETRKRHSNATAAAGAVEGGGRAD
jgi:hypothetical protein